MQKPTVSQLLDLMNKPALMKWANKIGLEGIKLDDYRKKSAGKGTSYHQQIENFLINKVPFESEEVQNKFIEFMKGKEVLNVEQTVECEYFHGRYDVRMFANGRFFLADFKSNSKVYFENVLQLAAYRMCLSDTDYKIARISIPDFGFHPIEIKDFTPYENVLKSLSSLYFHKGECPQVF